MCFASQILFSNQNQNQQLTMGKNDDGTVSREFKIQIAYITAGFILAAGGAIQANASMKREVEELKESNKIKTETLIRMENKFDMLNLKIEQLKEQLEAKKIVNTALRDTSELSGADFVTK